jgi:hypothetical protein
MARREAETRFGQMYHRTPYQVEIHQLAQTKLRPVLAIRTHTRSSVSGEICMLSARFNPDLIKTLVNNIPNETTFLFSFDTF